MTDNGERRTGTLARPLFSAEAGRAGVPVLHHTFSRLRCQPVSRGQPLRQCDARVQRAFHITDELVAGVLAREVETTESGSQRGADRRDLPRRGERVARAGPRVAV